MIHRLLATRAPAATILIRLLVGSVFLSEGIQKVLFPATRGAGRFAKIGLPAPELLGPFVAGTEIACGLLVLAGFLTRLASVPLVVVMLVALWTTKVPVLVGDGLWEAAHESRTDLSMLLASLFLIAVGAGRLSVDARLAVRDSPPG